MDKKTSLDNTVELKDLVYAPLQAIATANMRLSANIVDFLASTGDLQTDSSGKPVVQLRTIQMLYEQLRSDAREGTVSDCIGLEIPLLSIYPLSSLKVSKTKVSFDAEIKGMQSSEDAIRIYTQVCSKKQRDGANLPRFSYEVELEGVSPSEGLARFIDTLNAQAIPKLIHSKPVDDSGKKLTGRELEEYERQAALRQRESDLAAKLAEVKEQVRVKNNALKLETGMDYEEYRDHIDHLNAGGESSQPAESFRSIEQYQAMADELEAQLEELRHEIVLSKVQEDVQEQQPPGPQRSNPSEQPQDRYYDDRPRG